MNVKTAELIYFSPTGNTMQIIEAISQGINFTVANRINLTSKNIQIPSSSGVSCDLAIIGGPVYAGRLPEAMVSRFRLIKGGKVPAVIVVTFGNRAYEDALLELQNLVMEADFKPIAAAAFIGEHSFSTKELPIAVGRPDSEDLEEARKLGMLIRDKVLTAADSDQLSLPQLPGNYPYKEAGLFAGIIPSVSEHLCTRCMTCVSICPTGAIQEDNPHITDENLCIRCAACVKSCHVNARIMNHPKIKKIAEYLSANCKERKMPMIYLS